MNGRACGVAAALCLASPHVALGQIASPPSAAASTSASPPCLPAGTPVTVVLDDDLTSVKNKVGDSFQVVVQDDVSDGANIVIPKGTIGHGELTFVTNKGAFGKPGILGIVLDDLDLGGKRVSLEGHYREEGKNKDTAAAATMFTVGIIAGFVKGKPAIIPKGRVLKARIGEAIPYAPPVTLPVSADSVTPDRCAPGTPKSDAPRGPLAATSASPSPESNCTTKQEERQ